MIERIATGNPQLDDILGGGFPAHSINMLMGEPGCGKTILAERLMFANAEVGGRPIMFLTTLSEPLSKVVRYLQEFEFYNEEYITSGAIIYDSIGEELAAGGIQALIPRLKEAIKTLAPKIIVIDSFKALHDLSTSIHETRRMLHELAGLLTAYDTTAFLVGEYAADMISALPEFAIADAMLELARKKHGARDERYLRVMKLRGSAYQEGLHAFRITSRGLEVYPRLQSPAVPLGYVPQHERVQSGSAEIDRMLQGGLWAGSVALIEGSTGTGKTTIGLQFLLDGIKRGESGLYVNFQENPTQLARTLQALGWSIGDAQVKGLHFLYTSPVELQIDSILVELFRIVQDQGIKRVVVDAVGDLIAAASDPQRLFGYLYALSQHFVVRRVSTMLTIETTVAGETPLMGQVSAMCDAIMRLQLERDGDAIRRTFQIVKARGIDHDLRVHTMRITSNGLAVST